MRISATVTHLIWIYEKKWRIHPTSPSQWSPGEVFTSPLPSRDASLAPFHGHLHLWLCFVRPGCVTKMQQSQQWRNKASKAAADEQKLRVRGAFAHPPRCSNTCYVLRVMMLQCSIQTCLWMRNTVRIHRPFMPQQKLTLRVYRLIPTHVMQPFTTSDSLFRYSSYSTSSPLLIQ